MSAIDFHAAPRATARPGFAWPRLGLMLRVARERRALAATPEARLADMGLTPDEVMQEASRPFWDLPRTR